MHENNFEKQVQQKMGDLSFVPPDAVWDHVEKEIQKDNKRKKPFFWIFLFSGFLLLGGGYIWVKNNQSPINKTLSIESSNEKTLEQQSQSDLSNTKETRKAISPKGQEGEKENNNQKKDFATTKLSQPIIVKDIKTESETTAAVNGKETMQKEKSEQGVSLKTKEEKNKNIFLNKIVGASKIGPSQNKALKNDLHSKKGLTSRKENVEQIAKNENSSPTDIRVHINDGAKKEPKDADEIVVNDYRNKKKTIDSSMVKVLLEVAKTKSPAGDSSKLATAQTPQKINQLPLSWNWGFTGGIGVSNMNQALFKNASVAAAYSNPNLTNNPFGSSTVGTGPSSIRHGLSFFVGGFVNKHLSKRVSFTVGLNYHYYSTKTMTGVSVDSVTTVYTQNFSTTNVNGYYKNGNGNSYTNSYHFLELPFTLGFQLNKSKIHPLTWELGASYSYLIGSSALIYDPVTNVYFKDSRLFDKGQVMGHTGFMIGFPIRKSQLSLGPQIQYSFTQLLNNGSSNSGHLFYGGVKISFIPNKK
jgi:hypothetical protein